MSHYYDKNPELKSSPKSYEYFFEGISFKFTTDLGVFSKNFLDYGTYVLLKSYTPNIIDGPILDMCAGYGPVGVIVSKLYPKEVHMTEINERAYGLALTNVKQNNVSAKVYCGNLYEALPDVKYADILVNPPIRAGKSVVFAIYDGAFDRLLDGGYLYVVIQKKQGAMSSIKKLEELFGNCEIINRDSGYFILRAKRNNL